MRVFVSGQIEEKKSVAASYRKFLNCGWSITHDWTRTDEIGDKRANRGEAARRAEADVNGVLDCDVYVLLSNNQRVGKGMYVELGAALASRALTGRPRICVVGPMNHLSIFYLHPEVMHLPDVESVIDEMSRGSVSALPRRRVDGTADATSSRVASG